MVGFGCFNPRHQGSRSEHGFLRQPNCLCKRDAGCCAFANFAIYRETAMVLATLAQQPPDAVRIGASKMTDNERLQQLEAKIQLVTDRAEIADLVHRYGTGADRKDWKFMRSMFTDEIEVWLGRAGQPIEFRRVSVDKFTSGGDKVLGRFLVTQHTLTTNLIDVTGDDAVCLCDMQARHFKKPDDAEQKPW